jgi:hypothetical protein
MDSRLGGDAVTSARRADGLEALGGPVDTTEHEPWEPGAEFTARVLEILAEALGVGALCEMLAGMGAGDEVLREMAAICG